MIKEFAKKLFRPNAAPPFMNFSIPPEKVEQFAQESNHPLGLIFFGNEGPVVHKWIHYLEVYETYFSRFRGTDVKMLEIGVQNGGSLNMWRQYFGQEATIFGVDIDPACADRATAPNQVRIGSQNDPDFLLSVIEEMGGVDIVLDDGSHVATHQRTSFDTLFPVLQNGGLYAIEDLHTAYWARDFEGGYRRRGTAIERIKDMIDDMHAWHHNRRQTSVARDWIPGIHIFDSIAIIEKRKRPKPGHIRIGTEI